MQSQGQGDILKGPNVTITLMDFVENDTTKVVMVVVISQRQAWGYC